jgi:hypothetical protein
MNILNINLYLVKIEVNGIKTACAVVGKEPFDINEYEMRIKTSYYNGRKNIRERDKFKIIGFEIIKRLGLTHLEY